jgi:hypothetical protein
VAVVQVVIMEIAEEGWFLVVFAVFAPTSSRVLQKCPALSTDSCDETSVPRASKLQAADAEAATRAGSSFWKGCT